MHYSVVMSHAILLKKEELSETAANDFFYPRAFLSAPLQKQFRRITKHSTPLVFTYKTLLCYVTFAPCARAANTTAFLSAQRSRGFRKSITQPSSASAVQCRGMCLPQTCARYPSSVMASFLKPTQKHCRQGFMRRVLMHLRVPPPSSPLMCAPMLSIYPTISARKFV